MTPNAGVAHINLEIACEDETYLGLAYGRLIKMLAKDDFLVVQGASFHVYEDLDMDMTEKPEYIPLGEMVNNVISLTRSRRMHPSAYDGA